MREEIPAAKLSPLGMRLVIAFVTVVVVAMAIPSVYALRFLFSSVYHEAAQKMESDLEAASLLVEQEKSRMMRFGRTLARDELVEKMVAFRLGNPLAHRMQNFLESIPPGEVTALTVVDRDGVVLYRSHSQLATGDYAGDDPFISLALLDKETAAFERVPADRIAQEIGNVKLPERMKSSPVLILKAAVPIIQHEKEQEATSFKPLPVPIPGDVIGAVCVAYLMNTDRDLMTHIAVRTRDSAILYLGSNLINTSVKEWKHLTLKELTGGKAPLIRRGVRNYDKRGEIGGYIPLKDLMGNPIASLELRTSTKSIQRGWRRAVWNIAFFIAIGLIISTTLGYFIARRITHPILQLRKGAEEIGSGNLLYRINVSGGDEIAALANSFNEMGTQLHLSMEQMRLSKIQLEEYSSRLQEAHRNLEHRSRQLEQVNQQLLDSNVKLQKANEVKDTFLSTVSHELKTPLTTILGYVSMMQEGSFGKLDSDIGESLDVVLRRALNLRDLITDLLSLSQIDSGRLELQKRYYDISRDIRGVEEVFADRLKEKSLALGIRLKNNIPQAYADTDRINQVLLNLVGNAVKFTPNGGSITVSADYQSESNSILVSVKDTGIGIPQPELGHIFERFYQVDKRDGRRYGGTGLGLAISKELIELHGGGIWVESSEGKGSAFYFTLPVS